MTAYANFDLRLAGAAGAYTAEVLAAPAGQTSSPQPLAAALPSLPGLEDIGQTAWEAAGRGLWHFAFTGQIAGLWRASLATAAASGDGLRLRLIVDAPDLAGLPWELLYDDAHGRFLALDPGTPVVRFTRLPCAAAPWPQGRALRLLFTGATPQDLPHLQVAHEAAAAAAALAEPVRAGRLALTTLPTGATLPDLLAALRAGVEIWHFAGHGDQAGLVFDDGLGRAVVADAGTVGLLLAGEGVRLAVLNACRTAAGGGRAASVAAALVAAGVPAVIAMQGNLADAAGAALAQGLYAALAAGQPVDRGVTAGRKAILALGGSVSAAWWLPALFMRAPDGVLWHKEEDVAEKQTRQDTTPGDTIHTAGPAAARGSAVSAGSGVAFVGNGNTVITGQVRGNVTVGAGLQPAGADRQADLLRLLDDLRRQVAALPPGVLSPDDRGDALDTLALVSAQASRGQPPIQRIVAGLASVRAIIAGDEVRSPALAGLASALTRAARIAEEITTCGRRTSRPETSTAA